MGSLFLYQKSICSGHSSLLKWRMTVVTGIPADNYVTVYKENKDEIVWQT